MNAITRGITSDWDQTVKGIECAVTRNGTLETHGSWGRFFSSTTVGFAGGPVMEEIVMLAESLCRLESTLRVLWWWNSLPSLVSPLFCWNRPTEVSGSWPAPSCWQEIICLFYSCKARYREIFSNRLCLPIDPEDNKPWAAQFALRPCQRRSVGHTRGSWPGTAGLVDALCLPSSWSEGWPTFGGIC